MGFLYQRVLEISLFSLLPILPTLVQKALHPQWRVRPKDPGSFNLINHPTKVESLWPTQSFVFLIKTFILIPQCSLYSSHFFVLFLFIHYSQEVICLKNKKIFFLRIVPGFKKKNVSYMQDQLYFQCPVLFVFKSIFKYLKANRKGC